MKILYIPVTKKIREQNFKNYVLCFIYDIYIILRNFSFKKKITKNTSGYIESAIYSNAKIFEVPYYYCLFFSSIFNLLFDGIFINWKFTNFRGDKKLEQKLINLAKKYKIKKVIVDSRDVGISKINETVLNEFDFVIKREKNKSIINKKYLTTMLPCTLINNEISNNQEPINWNTIGKSQPNQNFKYDVFFSGKTTSKYRDEIIKLLNGKNYNFYGGLESSLLPYNQYLTTIYNSSINLALEGKGEFTFRHLEILANCSFMMCEDSINQIDLPLPIKDGEHFVSFNNNQDLQEKLDFYLQNENKRQIIALNGRKLLENYYSPKKHGDMILKKIFLD
tara:strand:- start:677 stop:1684 length:1008 start_codon:yes stop_codon:yes gene_type:complete